MTSDESAEVLAIVQRIGPVVMSAAVDLTTKIGSSLRHCVQMMLNDSNMVDLGTFQLAFGICVDLARNCGATLATMDRVRKAALAETPLGQPAIDTVNAIIRLALCQDARIIGTMSFRSRNEVEDIANAIGLAFSQAEEVASDDLDAGTYMGLINLHGATTAYLADAGRKLPRVVTYTASIPVPSLRMAQRAYGDPSRSDELIAENGVVHPAFMPLSGKMLAL